MKIPTERIVVNAEEQTTNGSVVNRKKKALTPVGAFLFNLVTDVLVNIKNLIKLP